MLSTETTDAAGCGPLSLCQTRLLMRFAKEAAAQNGTVGPPMCCSIPSSQSQEMNLLPAPTPGSLPHFQAMGEHGSRP